MDTATRLITADDLLMMSSDEHYELVKGELVPMFPGNVLHGYIVAKLGAALGNFVEEYGIGEAYGALTGFILERNPDTVCAPDIAFIREERIPPEDWPEHFGPIPPDLAVEVVSPDDSLRKVEEKAESYLAAGVSQVWVIAPKSRTVRVYRPNSTVRILGENDELDGEDVIRGFRYAVSKLFNRQRKINLNL